MDAHPAHAGPAAEESARQVDRFPAERAAIGDPQRADQTIYQPGEAPSQALDRAVDGLCKAGTLSVGVYPPTEHSFPIGKAMNRTLSINMGNCNHRKYLPHLVEAVRTGAVDPLRVLTQVAPMTDVLSAYRTFDQTAPGWMKVELVPGM